MTHLDRRARDAIDEFIRPSEPIEQSAPPTGKGWIHEVKFDGYRLQLHKVGEEVTIYSKNGKDFTARFRDIARAVSGLPVKSCVIDAEGVALDAAGRPDFRALAGGQKHDRVAWCFDLLVVDERDLRELTLVKRRLRLGALLKKARSEVLRLSEPFPDPLKLLEALDEAGLEGVVSKRTDQPYVSGKNRGWIKVKCHVWRATWK
ncbi:ATP-dependent DNA ligase [Hyphomicrobium nitrativorans NL23]|uniref:ATP-dependent DNA ligase n=1 Tax=Hyphomicrobium nitrativorans NL23 TaxID=1029756 RepID=V5SDN3_9HYPH|nr:ATP-dependent DNA ligase [Hyphomicrobium nitrativorans]AHB48165.1 ATP-dependent DNA ligase [Hyphomicrobium nitrativorans NL23]